MILDVEASKEVEDREQEYWIKFELSLLTKRFCIRKYKTDSYLQPFESVKKF